MHLRKISLLAVALFLLALAAACTAKRAQEVNPTTQGPTEAVTDPGPPEKAFETFDPQNFDHPTEINNPWFPMKPGTHYVYEGFTMEDGEKIPHRLEFTVTDLTKEIAGVRTVVAWVVDYMDSEVVEKEVAFFAQDNDGNVWYLGEHPENYEDNKFIDAPTWIHGVEGAVAGIKMMAKPLPASPSYSAGWGPAVDFKDRGRVAEMVAENCVRLDCYQEVLVIEEFTALEPGAAQLKYYASGVGNIRVGWKGADDQKEEMELIQFLQLNPDTLAQYRSQVLELEQHAYEISQDVYGKTLPVQPSAPLE